jgi:excisionase family DNA binding protein
MHTITPKQAAKALGYTQEGVRSAIKRGALPGVKVLGRYKIRLDDWSRIAGAPSLELAPCDQLPDCTMATRRPISPSV